MMYKHILIATDGSGLSESAIDHGLALAAVVDAKVTIVTVTEPWSALDIAAEVQEHDSAALEEFDERASAAAKRILENAAQRPRPANVKFGTVHMPNSHPAEGIMKVADRQGCDLIVMSSHGRRGIKRLLLGSQAYEVVSSSKIPVLIVR